MEILDPKSNCIADNLSVWQFMRRCHIYYLNMHPGKLCRIINEYLFLMHKKYNLYGDRFANREYNEIQEYDPDHLTTFRKIIYADILEQEYEPDADFTEMLYFYNDLMKIADKILDRVFIYGDEFTLEQGYCLIDACVAKAEYIFLSQKNIIITIPKKYFNLERYISINNFPGDLMYTNDENSVDIVMDNSLNKFGYVDVWNIKSSFRETLYCFVEWCATNDNILKICFSDSIL